MPTFNGSCSKCAAFRSARAGGRITIRSAHTSPIVPDGACVLGFCLGVGVTELNTEQVARAASVMTRTVALLADAVYRPSCESPYLAHHRARLVQMRPVAGARYGHEAAAPEAGQVLGW